MIWILFVVIGVVVVYIIFIYNRFITFNNRVQEAWKDIDVQLKRRYDLIPRLIETVKGYVKHEREVLEKVTSTRADALSGGSVGDRSGKEGMLEGALKSLFAVSENYPDLKANQNFIELQNELADTENKIQAARRFYNSTVFDINNYVEVFPSNIIASIFSFKTKEYFEVGEDEKVAPEVKF